MLKRFLPFIFIVVLSAVLKAPCLSLGASGKLAKTLVFFGWKGLNVVREYVVPSNPNTTLQQTQRGYLTSAVTLIHAEQAHASPLDEEDVMAYALWASVVQAATTWFNQAVRHCIDRWVLGKEPFVCRNGTFSGVGAAGFRFDIYSARFAALPACATGQFKYGTSKTALLLTQAATANLGGNAHWATFAGLASGTKYYVQFEGLTHADYLGTKSGIYHVTTT